jgi:hypothetical protein
MPVTRRRLVGNTLGSRCLSWSPNISKNRHIGRAVSHNSEFIDYDGKITTQSDHMSGNHHSLYESQPAEEEEATGEREKK